MAPKSTSQAQRTISSFFTPKSVPSRTDTTASSHANTASNQLNLANHFALTPSSKRTSKRVEQNQSDEENTEPTFKRRRVSAEDKLLQVATADTPLQSTPQLHVQDVSVAVAAQPASERTARYLFSSSSSSTAPTEEEESEDIRRERRRRHDQFVRKLSRPVSFRNPVDTHINHENADAGAENSGGEDEEEDPADLRKSKSSASKPSGKLTPMVKLYLDLKRQHLDKIIIYQVGYKYLFYGEDARIAAKELSIVCIPGKFRYDEHSSEAHLGRLASASIPIARLHVHVKRLVAAGHKVGVVKQLETAALKAAGDNRNTPFVRKLTNVYTKGTYVDDIEGLDGGHVADISATGTGYLLCLSETNLRGYGDDEKVHVGIVAVQPATGAIIYDDFEDGFMRSEIETRVLHIAPCEYLIVGDLSGATKKLIKHLSGNSSNIFGAKARVEHVGRAKTAAAESFSHVSSFYAGKLQACGEENEKQVRIMDRIHQFSEHVTICLSAMIKYLAEYGLEHVFDLTTNYQDFNMRTHMLLNGNTLNSLEIYSNQTDHLEKGSLFWRVDRTKTRFGKRMLRNWVGRPLLDKKKLEERINAVEELKDSDGKRESDRIKRVLNKIRSDLEKILIRIYYKRAARPEVLGFLQTMQNIANEYAHIKAPADAGFESVILNDTIALLPQMNEPVVDLLGRIRLQSAKEDDKYCFFREEHESEEVIDHKIGIASVEHDLEAHRSVAAATLGRKVVNYITVAGIEYLIEVENTKTASSKVPASWIKISNTKKYSRFHTPEVVKLIRERDQHKESLAAACDEAFHRFLGAISDKYQILRDCIRSLATLDCLSSLAEVANQPGYCKPEFVDDARIEVVQGRHPMVEQLLLDSYVPNDMSLVSHLSSQSESPDLAAPNALLVTGPNMGGKSSYVRSVALIAIMGQIGSYVPAKSARLGMLDGVFTRMGAFDNMMRGESTFMVELGETSDIMKQATRRSLVILDELGRGTSTHDGVAIAEAVLKELVDRGIMTLFITHYQDLAKIEDDCGGRLKNVHVKFEETSHEEITFLYEVGDGVAHRSYGLNVARLANIPQSVLDLATVKSRELEKSIKKRKMTNLRRMVACVFEHGEDDEATFQKLVGAIEQF